MTRVHCFLFASEKTNVQNGPYTCSSQGTAKKKKAKPKLECKDLFVFQALDLSPLNFLLARNTQDK